MSSRPALRRALLIAVVCAAAISFAGRGLTDEAAVSLQGDMPRYLLNGAFFYDAIRDAPLTDIVGYTYRYYARYPALSLGHHPILLPIAEAPVFAAIGISVAAGRITILLFLMLAVVFWFRLIADIYNSRTAFWSSLLLVTTPLIVELSQAVLSEIPTLALVIVALYYLHRYCVTEARRHAAAFALSAVLSIYAKQLAAFMLPVYVAYFAHQRGFRRLLGRDVVVTGIAMGLLLLPLALLTMKLSPFNVALVSGWVPNDSGQWVRTTGRRTTTYLLRPMVALARQLLAPVLVLSVMVIVVSLVKRDRRAALFLMWIALFAAQTMALGFGLGRLTVYWLPAFCLLAAAVPDIVGSRRWHPISRGILIAAVGYQLVLASAVKPATAGGYEEAARYVVNNPKGDAVLFSGTVDSGYFVFFVRKHDAHRELIVLRSDKVLTTSFLAQPDIERRIDKPEQVYDVLREFGVGYVVLEQTPYPDGPLRWLRQAVAGNRFVLRREIPIRSDYPRLRNVKLGVYEYLGADRANETATLKMNMPLVGRSIAVPIVRLLKPANGSE